MLSPTTRIVRVRLAASAIGPTRLSHPSPSTSAREALKDFLVLNDINALSSVTTTDIVLEAEDLTKQVSSPEGSLTIVDHVSLQIRAGESVAAGDDWADG